MIRAVKPLNVSSTIKTARWTLLILGIVYGNMHLKALKVFESKEHIIREEKIRIKYEKLAKENHIKTAADVLDLAKELEVTEFPPGWDDDL